MEIHRIDLKSETSSLIKIEPVIGWVWSNFLEEDIAGCIITDQLGESLKLHLINWRTRKSAIIDTTVIVCYPRLRRKVLTLEQSPHRFSASTTKAYLLMCTCNTRGEEFNAWSYSYEFLKECTERADSVETPYKTTAPPQFHHTTHYLDPENAIDIPSIEIVDPFDEIDRIIPTSRGLWTGDKAVLCMLTDGKWTARYLTYSLITDGTNPTHFNSIDESKEVLTQTSLPTDHSTTKFTRSSCERGFTYTYSEENPVAFGAQWQLLYEFGQWGKQAVWVDGRTDTQMVCRLVNFDQESDSGRTKIRANISTINYDQEDFRWSDLTCMQLDDASGILTCATVDEIWQLYFD
jgi:hypothetical protein